jgi:hypothetical protein
LLLLSHLLTKRNIMILKKLGSLFGVVLCA